MVRTMVVAGETGKATATVSPSGLTILVDDDIFHWTGLGAKATAYTPAAVAPKGLVADKPTVERSPQKPAVQTRPVA